MNTVALVTLGEETFPAVLVKQDDAGLADLVVFTLKPPAGSEVILALPFDAAGGDHTWRWASGFPAPAVQFEPATWTGWLGADPRPAEMHQHSPSDVSDGATVIVSGTITMETVGVDQGDQLNERCATTPLAFPSAQAAADPPQDFFPQHKGGSTWVLSDGSTFRGKKADALVAQQALYAAAADQSETDEQEPQD
jgi:hypothetical protein